MGQGQSQFSNHRAIGSQQNRDNTAQFGVSGGSAMPRGRGGRISRGTRRGGTGDQMQPRNLFSSSSDPSRPMSMSSYRPGTMPGMTTIQTPDFMQELNETFSNSPFQQYGYGFGRGGGDTMQIARSGGGRGGVIPTREEALQGRLDAPAMQNAAMQSGQMMPMYGGGYGGMMGRPTGVVDPYMVEQALGEGNFQDAMPEVGMEPRQRMGMGYGNPMDYGNPNLAIANQSDFNFDGGVGLDDMAMALKAQAAGRAYEAPDPFTMDDMMAGVEAQEGVRDQYGAQEMRERRQRNMDRRMERLMSDMPAPRPRDAGPNIGDFAFEPPPPGSFGGGEPFLGRPDSQGRLQTRSQRGAGRGRRRFGHGGIIDAYGRRLV